MFYLLEKYFKKSENIHDRMKNYLNKNEKKCHPYKSHIVSLKCKDLLKQINKRDGINEKKRELVEIQEKIVNVSKEMYDYFNPTFMYCFNNEIHLVFKSNENGTFIYDGDINKLITMCASFASSKTTNIFSATFVEFDDDYELLNYIIWRQLESVRNTSSILYKCLNPEYIFVDEPLSFITENLKSMGFYDDKLINGCILKKTCVQNRKHIKCIYENLSTDFDINYKLFVDKHYL